MAAHICRWSPCRTHFARKTVQISLLRPVTFVSNQQSRHSGNFPGRGAACVEISENIRGCDLWTSVYVLFLMIDLNSFNSHPNDMECPVWWNAHQVSTHSSTVTPNLRIEYYLRAAERIIVWFLIRCHFSTEDYNVLAWRITGLHALLGNPLFTSMTQRSSTKAPEMDRKDKFALFYLPIYLYWLFISS